MITITQAEISHLRVLVPLFEGYRKFYKQVSNVEAARTFLTNRITQNNSVIYIAYLNDIAVGFTQLYPLFSSVTMESMYILNDLYIDSNYRNRSIGEALINKAKKFAIENDLKGLAIQTAYNNPAQHLYQRLDFVKDTDLQFFWTNTNKL